jgi:2-keto-3-deoxy-L-arabinonate dehydratase
MSTALPFGSPSHPSVIPVLPTPFTPTERLDLAALPQLVAAAADTGATAVCLPAYGSEFYKLSDEERETLVQAAIGGAAGRLPIVAQSNHPSAVIAAEVAKRYEGRGAAAIAIALPRQFALTEADLLRYAARVASAVSVPLLIQDFNPGGAAVGASFAKRLKEAAPHFAYLKLEEPLMGEKVTAIREATRDGVGVLEGWGGMHVLELLPAGIAGVMPGLGLCGPLRAVIVWARDGRLSEATDLFERLLPFIHYSLQNMEVFHHCEKRLLHARGLLPHTVVREARLELGPTETAHIDRLVERLTALSTSQM